MTDSSRTAAPAHLSAVVVGFAILDDELQVGVLKRESAPLKGRLHLPGDTTPPDRITAGAKELARQTFGVRTVLRQLRVYDAIRRDPRGPTVTVGWWTVLRPDEAADASVEWLAAQQAGSARLAFEQAKLVADAVDAAREEIRFTPIATGLCEENFTMAQLRRVYEILWGADLDPANFHRKVTGNTGFVQPTQQLSHGGPGRPAQLYRPGDSEKLALPMSRTSPVRASGGAQ